MRMSLIVKVKSLGQIVMARPMQDSDVAKVGFSPLKERPVVACNLLNPLGSRGFQDRIDMIDAAIVNKPVSSCG